MVFIHMKKFQKSLNLTNVRYFKEIFQKSHSSLSYFCQKSKLLLPVWKTIWQHLSCYKIRKLCPTNPSAFIECHQILYKTILMATLFDRKKLSITKSSCMQKWVNKLFYIQMGNYIYIVFDPFLYIKYVCILI